MSMTDPSNDYANGDGMLTLEDIEQRSEQLSKLWTEELDRDVNVAFLLKQDEWVIEIDGDEFGRYLTEAQLTDALTTLLNT